jgi:hypothetical protein
MDDYRLFVNEDRTIMVRMWSAPVFGKDEVVEVAVRDTPAHIWGPPVVLKEEK